MKESRNLTAKLKLTFNILIKNTAVKYKFSSQAEKITKILMISKNHHSQNYFVSAIDRMG
jgi:hypothetical protein